MRRNSYVSIIQCSKTLMGRVKSCGFKRVAGSANNWDKFNNN